jgi:transposase InsO family protein
MSVRRLVVEVDLDGLNVSRFCREHGISTWFFYQLRKRFAVEGEAALQPRPPIAKTVPNRTPGWVEDLIIDLRKELDGAGLDAGPATIRFHLSDRLGAGTAPPSEATIWRILTRRGFVVPTPDKAPKHAHRTFAAERANECWQIDDITWQLANRDGVKIITLIDDCTRLCPGLAAVETVNGDSAFEAFSEAAVRWGWPAWFLSDNAATYRHTLAAAVGELGVDHRHGRPNHPQTQGKVERFHQTLQKWLAVQPPAPNLSDLQTQLDQFTQIYNHSRPHRAIQRRTPASVFAATPKAGPANRPLGTPTSIHRVTVTGGTCHINKRLSITVGAIHNGRQATVIITGPACHVFIGGRLTRHLTLDPTRRYQPLYPRPGRP